MILDLFCPKKVENLVRVGSKNDGGYLIPDDLKFDLLISFGLGDDWNFEKELISNGKISNFIVFDHSVSLYQLLTKVGLSAKKIFDDPMNFVYRLRIALRYFFSFFGAKHVKLKVVKKMGDNNEISVDTILETHTSSIGSCILKVDIEGGEWSILEVIQAYNHKIDVLIIEFHNINENVKRYADFKHSLKNSHSLIHIHANNFSPIGREGIPDVLEATFAKNSLISSNTNRESLPIVELDAPCAPNRPDYFWDFIRETVSLE
jgi:hypothetical protein